MKIDKSISFCFLSTLCRPSDFKQKNYCLTLRNKGRNLLEIGPIFIFQVNDCTLKSKQAKPQLGVAYYFDIQGVS